MPAANRTWDGGGGDELASTAANWDLDNPIVAGDVIAFDNTSVKNCTWDISTSVAGMSFAATYSGSFTNMATLNCASGVANFTWNGTGYCSLTGGICNISGTFTIGGTANRLTFSKRMNYYGNLTCNGVDFNGSNPDGNYTSYIWSASTMSGFTSAQRALQHVVIKDGATLAGSGENRIYNRLTIGEGVSGMLSGSFSHQYAYIYQNNGGAKISASFTIYTGGTLSNVNTSGNINLYNIIGASAITIQGGLTANALQTTISQQNNTVNTGNNPCNFGSISLWGDPGYTSTLVCGSSTITVTGNVVAATRSRITAGSSTWYVGGSWTNTGAFTANNCTIILTNNATVNHGAKDFYNLTADPGAGKTVTLVSGAISAVTNVLRVQSGTCRTADLISRVPKPLIGTYRPLGGGSATIICGASPQVDAGAILETGNVLLPTYFRFY
ncbi:MAG: hypothetical protein L6455_02135 [Kiritimatiellae bacterium]|nr:hypothetical protein [Kiritimatiellia bacterium]